MSRNQILSALTFALSLALCLGTDVVCEHFQGMAARRAAVVDDGVLEAHVLGWPPLCLGAHQKPNVRVASVSGQPEAQRTGPEATEARLSAKSLCIK